MLFWENCRITSFIFSRIYDGKIGEMGCLNQKVVQTWGILLFCWAPLMSIMEKSLLFKYAWKIEMMTNMGMIMMTMTLHRVMTGIIGGGVWLVQPQIYMTSWNAPKLYWQYAGIYAMCHGFQCAKMFIMQRRTVCCDLQCQRGKLCAMFSVHCFIHSCAI